MEYICLMYVFNHKSFDFSNEILESIALLRKFELMDEPRYKRNSDFFKTIFFSFRFLVNTDRMGSACGTDAELKQAEAD